jgi:deoxycytidine triphosphate deaminase
VKSAKTSSARIGGSVLSDLELMRRIQLPSGDGQRLVIEPFVRYDDPHRPKKGEISHGISSAGYDLCLGNRFFAIAPYGPSIDPLTFRFDDSEIQTIFWEKSYVIEPGAAVLAEVFEYLEIPWDCVGDIIGKSTWARVFIELNTTTLEPGWRGRPTLEIKNNCPRAVVLHPGRGICQVRFSLMTSVPLRHYGQRDNAHYQDAYGLQGPMVGKRE